MNITASEFFRFFDDLSVRNFYTQFFALRSEITVEFLPLPPPPLKGFIMQTKEEVIQKHL